MASLASRLDNLQSYQNLILNGNMDFFQRSTSLSVPTGGSFVADRWKNWKAAAYTTTVSRSADVPTLAQSGFQSAYSLLWTNGTGASPGAGDYQQISYGLEGFDYQQLHGKKGRLQFWCKSSVTGTYCLSLNNSAYSRGYVTTFSIPSANTWQKVSFDLTFDTSGTWLFDNGAGLYLQFNLTAGSSLVTSTLNQWFTVAGGASQGATGQTQWGATTGATFQLAQVSLIPGDFTQASASNVDIPFMRAGKTIGDELRMCQRYYEKSYDQNTVPATIADAGSIAISSIARSNTSSYVDVPYKVSKRAGSSASITLYNPNSTTTTGVVDRSVNGAASSEVAAAAGSSYRGDYGFIFSTSSAAGDRVSYFLHFVCDNEI